MATVDTARLKGFLCPKCRLLISAKDEQIGAEVACPSCCHLLYIPPLQEVARQVLPRAIPATSQSIVPEYSGTFSDDWREPVPKAFQQVYASSLPWYMVIPASVIGLVLVSFMLVELGNTKPRPLEIIATGSRQSEEMASSELPSEVSNQEVEAFCKKLAATKTVEELAPLVLPIEEIELKLSRYYADREVRFPEFERVKLNMLARQRMVAILETIEEVSANRYVLFRRRSGELLLDWESYVQYCSIPWKSMAQQRPTALQTVRVLSRKIEYYNHEYQSDQWQSFEISRRDCETVYIGYARKKGVANVQLSPIGDSSYAKEVTLAVRYPQDAQSANQMIIEKVLATNWIANFTE